MAQSRKPFRYFIAGTVVTIVPLTYETPDSDPVEGEAVSFDAAELPAEFQVGDTVMTLVGYGLSQFLQDRSASKPVEEKLARMQEVFERLKEGEWKAARESSGPSERKANIDPFFAAGFASFLQSQGKEVDATTATTLLQGMSKEDRATLRSHDAIKEHIEAAKAKAQEAASGIDLAKLLG